MSARPTDMIHRVLTASLGGSLPVLLIGAALLAGCIALIITPREEEPQIVVPSADVLVDAPGLDARQVERLITTPLERLLAQIDGVEHVYSTTVAGRASVMVSFFVGQDREDSILKLFSKVYAHQDEISPEVRRWAVKPVEVDDVPILVASLWSEDPAIGTYELRRLADEVSLNLQSVPDTNRIEVIGGEPREFLVNLDPIALAGRATSIDDVLFALSKSHLRRVGGEIDLNNSRIVLELDARARSADQLAGLTVNVVNGVPVYLADVAEVIDGPAEPRTYSWARFSSRRAEGSEPVPVVNVALAKRRGANAVTVAQEAIERLAELEATLFPAGVRVEITRNYGATANDKILNLLSSLGVAVLVVVALIGLTLGWRAALVVALAVPVCYGITLALDLAAGYTINRVTLFALILALGLLVDDPITGVDNMQRHLNRGTGTPGIVDAMVEIRLPLIMSTIAIVIVFAPMSFITGMMGPYMSPMAFNVPVAVITSTLVAFAVTPWLGAKLLRPQAASLAGSATGPGWYERLLMRLLARRDWSVAVLIGLVVLLILVCLLPLTRSVPLKLLPFDNKNEFSVVIDAPEGSTLESTNAAAARLAQYLVSVPEVELVNAYVGTHAPMDFNGMIRRYYLRNAAHQAELHVVLADKLARRDQSHTLILRHREQLARLGAELGVDVKVVEVPPGPPVISTIVAEHYGTPDTPYARLVASARATAARLRQEPGVLDVDSSAIDEAVRLTYVPDQEKAALSGIGADVIGNALAVLGDGLVAGYAAVPDEAEPLPIRIQVPYAQRGDSENVLVRGLPGITKIRERGAVVDAPTPMVSLQELGEWTTRLREQPIHHKDLRPVSYAFAEVAGRVPAEIVFDVDADLGAVGPSAPTTVGQRSYFRSGGGLPWSLPAGVSVDWGGEGEWKITLRVFRDLGIAFAVALVGLYVVIRLQTGLTALTLIIMSAIPLTAIGILPGFWLLNGLSAEAGGFADPVLFTATAMIGMIALAGIVVRNSLILVEFIEQQRQNGMATLDAIIGAGRARTRPVLLTAGTTMLGNLVITLDPIFAGLAWAIIFGIAASTLFTLVVVPLCYQLVYGGSSD